MKSCKVLALVFLFFFLIGCEDSVKRLTPANEANDGNSEITDDSDVTDTDDADPADTTPDEADSTDTIPSDDDSTDTIPVDDDSTDTIPTDDDSTDTNPDDDADSADTTPDSDPAPVDNDPIVVDPAEECVAAGGVWENGECKHYCSAVFDGEKSKIEISANDALNLADDTWTIEAWIKQAEDDINSSNLPIVRKGTGATPVYVLTGYKKQNWGNQIYYTVMGYVGYSYTTQQGPMTQPGNGTLQPTGNNITYSSDWTHIALVQNKETSGTNPFQQTTTYKLLLFLNGEQVASEEYTANNNNGSNINTSVTPTIKTNNESLVIGAHIGTDPGLYFKGLIDSIKISNTAKYTAAFTPAALSADDTTVAFWDFSGNADDSSENGLNGTETEITYSEDCK